MRKIQILRETRKRLRGGNFAGICIAIRDVLVDNEIDHNIRTVFPLLLETSAERYRKPKDYLYDEYWWKPILSLTDKYVHAWSLDSLINLGRKIKGVTDFNLNMCLEYGWYLEFRGYDKNKNHGLLHESFATKPIDAAYDMTCWLLENKYI